MPFLGKICDVSAFGLTIRGNHKSERQLARQVLELRKTLAFMHLFYQQLTRQGDRLDVGGLGMP